MALATKVTKLPNSLPVPADPGADGDSIVIHNGFKAIISNYHELPWLDFAGSKYEKDNKLNPARKVNPESTETNPPIRTKPKGKSGNIY